MTRIARLSAACKGGFERMSRNRHLLGRLKSAPGDPQRIDQ